MANDYSDLLTPPSQPQSAVASSGLDPSTTPGDYSDLLSPAPQEKVSATGLSKEPMPGWQQGYASLSDAATRAGASMNKVGAGFILSAGGDLEEARASVETQALHEAQQHREDFINTHAHLNLFHVRDLPWESKDNKEVFNAADIPSWIIEQVPQFGTILAGGAAGGMAGAVFGPAGVPVGMLAGSSLAAAATIFGSHVYDQMDRGVPHDHAVIGGIVSGAIGGVATTLGLHKVGELLPSAAQVIFKNGGVRAAIGELAGILTKGVGIDASAGAVQSSVDAGLKYVETNVTGKVVKPVTLAEMLTEIAGGTLGSAVSSAALGGLATATGVHAGKRALKAHAEVEKAVTAFNDRMTKLMEAQARLEQQETAKRTQETKEKTTVQQTKARRQLKGFVEVDRTLEVVDAQKNYDDSVAANKAAPSTQNKAAVNQARAELQHAKFSAKLNAMEEALTDPDLSATIAGVRQNLEGRLQVLQEHRDMAQTHTEKGAFDKAIAEVKRGLQGVKDFEALGSADEMRAHVERMKAQLQGHVNQTRLEVAKKALEHRIATRAIAIEHLRVGIREHKAAAKIDFTEHRTGNSAPAYGDIPAVTAHQRERLEQLREQQELDIFLLGMLEAGELGANDVKDLSPQAPTARLQGLAEMAQRKVDQAAKAGGKQAKREMKAAKKLLDKIVDLSRLPAEDKAKLKASYATMDLQGLRDSLPTLQGEIKKQFEARRLEAARADLKNALKSIKVDPTAKSKYPGVEGLLERLKQFATDPEALEKFLEGIEQKDELSDDDLATLELTKLFPDEPKKLSAAQIEKIIDAIVELQETGKAEALKQYNERKARQAKKYERVVSAMGGKTRKAGIKAQLDRILDDKVAAEVKSWRGLMTMVTQFGEATDLADVFDVKSAISEMHRIRLHWEKRFEQMIADKGIKKGTLHKFMIDSRRQVKGELVYRHVEVIDDQQFEVSQRLEKPNGDPYPYGELIQIRNYLLDEDPDAVSRLKGGNGFSYPNEVMPGTSTLEVIERHLDGHLKDWRIVADTMREFYTPEEFGSVVGDTVKRRYGRDMPANWTYGGQLLGSADQTSRETFRRFSNRPGSTKRRTGGDKRVEIRDAFDNLRSHITQYSREHAMFELEQDLPAIFNREDIKDKISRTIGDNTNKVIGQYIQDVVFGQKTAQTQMEKVITHLSNSLYFTFLGARPEQVAKQLSGAVHALQFVGPGAVLDGYAYMLSNPDESFALMNKSGSFQERQLAKSPDFTPGVVGDIKRFNEFSTNAVKVGDEYASVAGAFPVLLAKLRETGDEKAALRAFETAFDTTQSSHNVDERPSLFRGNAAVRLFAFLAQEPTRQVEAIDSMVRKWRAGKATVGDVARVVAVTYLGAALYNLLGYIIMYPFLSDEQREQKLNYIIDVMPLGPFAGMAVVGQALSSFSVLFFRTVFNQDTKAYEPDLLPGNIFADVMTAEKKTLKLIEEGGDTKDYWSALIWYSRVVGDLTGLPIVNIERGFEWMIPGARD